MIIIEIWKDIEDYERYYQVSNFGRIRSLTRVIVDSLNRSRTIYGRDITINELPNGYQSVTLSQDDCKETKLLHRLMAIAFIPNPNNLPVINHKNHIRNDNRLENFEWCTQSENILYSANNGRHCGNIIGTSVLNEDNIIKIFSLYANGMSQIKIGKIFGVKDNTINGVLQRKTWKHIIIDDSLLEACNEIRKTNFNKYFKGDNKI